MRIFGLTVTATALLLLLTGCGREEASSAEASNKVRIGYIGITCEAPIFTAVEKGFFKEEGLDVSLVRCDWKNYKDVLALGGYLSSEGRDITQPDSALTAIALGFSIVPAVLTVASLWWLRQYARDPADVAAVEGTVQ